MKPYCFHTLKLFFTGMMFIFSVTLLEAREHKSFAAFQQEMEAANDKTKKLELFHQLFSEYSDSEMDSLAPVCKMVETFIEQAPNDVAKGWAYCDLARYYDKISDPSKTIGYYEKAFNISKTAKDENFATFVNFYYGEFYMFHGDNAAALEHLLPTETHYTKNKEYIHLINLYTRLAGVYDNLEQQDKVDYYSKKVIDLVPLTDNQYAHYLAYTAYARWLMGAGKTDEATEYLGKAFEISEKMNDFVNIAGYYMNMGFLSMYFKHDTTQAIRYFIKGGEILKNDSPGDYCIALDNLIFAYISTKQYAKAEALVNQGLALAKKQDMERYKKNFAKNKAIICAEKGDFKVAYQNQLDYSDILERESSKENQQQINYLSAKYEAARRETQIEEMKVQSLTQQKELRRRNVLLVGSIVVIGLLALSIIFYRRYSRLKANSAAERIKSLEQEKLLVATQAVLDGETAERTRLARDLHDGLGGMLSVVKLNLNDMKQGSTLENTDVQRFNSALKMLDDSIGELRRVSHNMMPDSLSHYGLKAALTDFCNSVMGAEFNYFGSGDRLDSKLEVMIYRTVHELVNNVLKHAGATKISVQVVQETDRIAVTVQDDGSGFDTAAETSGTGLKNIRNRVASYNGRIDIYSKLGEGTEVNLEFVIPEKNS